MKNNNIYNTDDQALEEIINLDSDPNENIIQHLNNISFLKNKLYEIHNSNKFESLNNIYSEISKHDQVLAKTLTLIISDFNTQLNMHQTHFTEILNKLLIHEEKKLMLELKNNKNEKNTKNNKNEKIVNNKFVLTDNATKLLSEYKLIIYLIIIFILASINSEVVAKVFSWIKNIL
jgi:hypothetical protein